MSSSDSDEEDINLSESGSEDCQSEFSDTSIEDESDEQIDGDWFPCNENTPASQRFPFIGNPGCTFAMHSNPNEFDYYNLFFDDDVINLIVTESNRYAQQTRKVTAKPWIPITNNELHIYLAIKILQGMIKKPEERMYWSKTEVLETPIFAKLMSNRRYCEIQQFLHFSDNETYDANTHPQPKLNKIWPVLDIITKKCSSLYIPERDVTIDESLMLYKGRLSWKQYLPLKRARFGIKLFCLCESKSGYLFSIIIYTGKGSFALDSFKDSPISTQIVMVLMEPLLNMGYCLTTDNYYTSPDLANLLISNKTDLYGTVRANRKEMPKNLVTKKLQVGETIGFQRGKVTVMKWRDKKDIYLLSTVHNLEMVET